jgi:hypothetical protein
MLRVIETSRQQGRNTFTFVASAVYAHFTGDAPQVTGRDVNGYGVREEDKTPVRHTLRILLVIRSPLAFPTPSFYVSVRQSFQFTVQ